MKNPNEEQLSIEELNAFLTNMITEQNRYADELVQAAVKKDLGPLNEHSRSLLHADLSTLTRRLEERRLAKMARKKEALKKPKPNMAWSYARRRTHWAKLAATQRRKKAKVWRETPWVLLPCLCGAWRVDVEAWKEHIAPLWERYKPEDLSFRQARKIDARGTREKPYTIYSIDIVHVKEGVVWNGRDMEVYVASIPRSPES